MANFIKELSERYNLQSDNQQVWGTVDGYWFQVMPPAYGRNKLIINTAVHAENEAAEVLTSGLADLICAFPSTKYNIQGGTITIEQNIPFKGLKTEDIENLLKKLTVLFRDAGATAACFNCNSVQTDGFAKVNGVAMKLCSECSIGIEGTIAQETEAHATAQNHYFTGTIGALLGALIGSIAWVLIGLLGYLAAIGGIAIAFCAAKGYTMMKGKVNALGIVIICLICIVVMVVAQFVTVDIQVLNEFSKAGSPIGFWDATSFTLEVIQNEPEVTSEFIKDTLLGLLFLALGSYSIIKSLVVQAKSPAGSFQRL